MHVVKPDQSNIFISSRIRAVIITFLRAPISDHMKPYGANNQLLAFQYAPVNFDA